MRTRTLPVVAPVLALALGLAACGAKVSTEHGDIPFSIPTETTWSGEEKTSYVSTCPFGEKQCNCTVEAFEKKNITYAQVKENPSLTGDAVSSKEFSDCMN